MAKQKEGLGKKAISSLVIMLVFAMMSCATWESNKTTSRKVKKPTRQTSEARAPVEKEIKRPEAKQFASISNPARKASMGMVQKGKTYLTNNKYSNALGAFREAIIIDSTNGIAYYYMSKTRFYLDQFEEALGILDKAEALLATSEQWIEAVTMLRTQIERAYIKDGQARRSELIPIIMKRDDT